MQSSRLFLVTLGALTLGVTRVIEPPPASPSATPDPSGDR